MSSSPESSATPPRVDSSPTAPVEIEAADRAATHAQAAPVSAPAPAEAPAPAARPVTPRRGRARPPRGLHAYNRRFYERIANDPRVTSRTVHEQFHLGRRDPSKVNICIRHDVDRALNHVIPLAEYEAAMGVRTSYYFLTDTAPYDLWASEAPRVVASLGHEVGLHSDHMYEQVALGRDGLSRLREDVERLSEHAGVPVRGVCWHGSSYLRPYGINNYDLYQDLEASELGLEYHDSVFYEPGTRSWRTPILSDSENNLRFARGKPTWAIDQRGLGEELLYVAHPRGMFPLSMCQPLNWPDYPHFPPNNVQRTLLMDLRSMIAYNKDYLGPRRIERARRIIRWLEKLGFKG